ncbi:hypothetical protein SAMN05444164_0336 [Bradyrhizobium erythrophlei]|uniref:Uncharacterized protein n=1 Tax=Bradyrhizobium erythrophlei TaxID=1437360 RepID=A0A1H4MJA2_9BRAD|nr:hypothetical protein SAMN05444164_0336 [Bradyrhizobium erythrophlei]
MTGGATRLFRDDAANLPVLRLGSTHSIDRSVTAGTGGPSGRNQSACAQVKSGCDSCDKTTRGANQQTRQAHYEKIFRLAFAPAFPAPSVREMAKRKTRAIVSRECGIVSHKQRNPLDVVLAKARTHYPQMRIVARCWAAIPSVITGASGILDHPHARVMTPNYLTFECEPYPVIAAQSHDAPLNWPQRTGYAVANHALSLEGSP